MRSLADASVLSSLLVRLDGLRPEAQPRWGVMVPGQMLQHLAGAFRMATGEIPARPQPSPLKNTVARFLVLRSGIQWPHGSPTIPELDLRGVPPPPLSRFAPMQAEVGGLMTHFSGLAEAQLRAEHPLLGPLSHLAWMRWGYLHTDHHLRQFGL